MSGDIVVHTSPRGAFSEYFHIILEIPGKFSTRKIPPIGVFAEKLNDEHPMITLEKKKHEWCCSKMNYRKCFGVMKIVPSHPVVPSHPRLRYFPK